MIGKYGGDTDNWVWPRHTGDFSLFRIYSAPDGSPAEPSADNVHASPRPTTFPCPCTVWKKATSPWCSDSRAAPSGYIPAAQVEHLIDVLNPTQIGMRTASLEVINSAMRADDATRIAYAAKQSRIANAWKKWIGQNEGLIDFGTVAEKQQAQLAFAREVVRLGLDEYTTVVGDLGKDFAALRPYLEARSLFIEWFYWSRAVALGRRGGGHPDHGRRQVRVRQRIRWPRRRGAGSGRGLLCGLQCRRGPQGLRRGVPPLHGRHA